MTATVLHNLQYATLHVSNSNNIIAMENNDSSSTSSPPPLIEIKVESCPEASKAAGISAAPASASASSSSSLGGITVVPNTGDGPKASESTGVIDALGTCSTHNGKSNNRKKIVENVKDALKCLMEKMTPNMGIPFLALTVQTIYQLKFPTPATTREGKAVRILNGIAAALLLYGLVVPKSAGGCIALLLGVLLASWVAIIISFTN